MPDSEKFETEIYHAGVHFTLEWKDRKQYELGKAFLDNLAGYDPAKRPPREFGGDFYYLESDQLDALYTFRQELRKRHKG